MIEAGSKFRRIRQPHTIVKQICFSNGNVTWLSLFSLSKNWMHNVVWNCAEILPCKDQIVLIPRRKHLGECWLPWINWEALITEYLFRYLLNETRVSMPWVIDILFPNWFINNSNPANLLLNSRSDATCVSVAWWLFSLCKFSVLHSPRFQIWKFFVSHSNVI